MHPSPEVRSKSGCIITYIRSGRPSITRLLYAGNCARIGTVKKSCRAAPKDEFLRTLAWRMLDHKESIACAPDDYSSSEYLLSFVSENTYGR